MDLILNPEIEAMLEKFYRISGLRVGLHDENMEIITEYPLKSREYDGLRFCDRLRFQSPRYTELCAACDRQAYLHVCRTRKTYIYTCHGGFYEALIPILIGDVLMCCFMIGQVRRAEFACSARKALESVDAHIPLTKDLAEAYERMPCMSLETFSAHVYFLEICANYIYENHFIRLQGNELIVNFQRYVEEHIRQPLYIGDVAAALHVSPTHLSRTIAGELQTTFTDYLNRARIEEAKDMLITTDMSTAQIAEALSYNEPTYFMRVFKKITGMTCTEFRRQK